MRLAIVGSTILVNNLEVALIIADVVHEFDATTIISGGAPGVDTMAEDFADANKIAKEIYRPDVKRWFGEDVDGKRGFRERNLQIARACEGLVRIYAKSSTTFGSGYNSGRC
jgi:YspA, cpYpsA-related SLOG family